MKLFRVECTVLSSSTFPVVRYFSPLPDFPSVRHLPRETRMACFNSLVKKEKEKLEANITSTLPKVVGLFVRSAVTRLDGPLESPVKINYELSSATQR